MKKTISLILILIFLGIAVAAYFILRANHITEQWFCLAVAGTFVVFWLCCKFIFKFMGLYGVNCKEGILPIDSGITNTLVNGVGRNQVGKLGKDAGAYRSYRFFCILHIPLWPLDCLVQGPKFNQESDGKFSSAQFQVLGRSPWYPLEVALLMWRPWAIICAIIALIMLL